jgi:hypothetical protein
MISAVAVPIWCSPVVSPGTMEGLVSLLQEIVDRFATADHSYRLSLRSRAEILFCQLSLSDDVNDEFLNLLVLLITSLRASVEQCNNAVTYQTQLVRQRRGRPRCIGQGQLQYLLDVGFRVPSISLLLGVSRRTVWRGIAEHTVDATVGYSDICDEDLNVVVSSIQSSFPNCGHQMLNGRLRSQGIVVERTRPRESIQRTDPAGVILRQRLVLSRRAYHVAPT